jgi:putative hydrolase of the HAD superfamily
VIRALVTDFGGVLTTPLSAGFSSYYDETGVSAQELGEAMGRATEAHGEHPLYALERGEISEAEFGRRLNDQLEAGFDLGRLRDLLFERIEPNEPMIEFVADVRGRGLRTALLTNNVREWEPLWQAKLPPLDSLFDVVVDSAFVGMRKPEPEIFVLTLERLGLQAEECLFVDDLELNCEAARELGLNAVRHEEAEATIAEIEAIFTKSRNVRHGSPRAP